MACDRTDLPIISVSRKTDVPAFYSDWLVQRLRDGYAIARSSYGGDPKRVSLAAGDLTGFLFWTKNITPLLQHLPEVRERAPFVVQYTLTGYPSAIEPSVDHAAALGGFLQVAESYGGDIPVWRYDPVLVTADTSVEWHKKNFSRLAGALAGSTTEVIISFFQLGQHKKAVRALKRAGVTEVPFERKDLLHHFLRVARQNGMMLSLCVPPLDLQDEAPQAHCADALRFAKLVGTQTTTAFGPSRSGCGCFKSIDIGRYDTCRHGCIYCYATSPGVLAKYKHNPKSTSL